MSGLHHTPGPGEALSFYECEAQPPAAGAGRKGRTGNAVLTAEGRRICSILAATRAGVAT